MSRKSLLIAARNSEPSQALRQLRDAARPLNAKVTGRRA